MRSTQNTGHQSICAPFSVNLPRRKPFARTRGFSSSRTPEECDATPRSHLNGDRRAPNKHKHAAATQTLALLRFKLGKGAFIALKFLWCTCSNCSFSSGEIPALVVTLQKTAGKKANKKITDVSRENRTRRKNDCLIPFNTTLRFRKTYDTEWTRRTSVTHQTSSKSAFSTEGPMTADATQTPSLAKICPARIASCPNASIAAALTTPLTTDPCTLTGVGRTGFLGGTRGRDCASCAWL